MKRILTGIKPTGRPHLGNYLASIRPSLSLSEGAESFLFIADLHALTTLQEGKTLRSMTREVAATWLACGLDPEKTVFFRQSDIPEVPELSWILSCYTAKGLLDRGHAYKAAQDEGAEVTAGLYGYPVLMAADILAFKSTHVPVGQDQKQHLEIAREIAIRFNHHQGPILTVPEPVIAEAVAVVPGLDGRKMSKSYDNTIPLFDKPEIIQKKIFSIKTDSTPLDQPKNPDTCTIFKLYSLLASPEEKAALEKKYRAPGMGWKEAKEALLGLHKREFGAKQALYDGYVQDPAKLDRLFSLGAEKARAVAAPLLKEIKKALGLS